MEQRLTGGRMTLGRFANGHEYFGLRRERDGGWVFREWAPAASAVTLIGTATEWEERPAFALRRIDEAGVWEVRLPAGAVKHGDLYRLRLRWDEAGGDRIPAYARRVVQDEATKVFNAQVWAPAEAYAWQHAAPPKPVAPLVYEAHVGMAQERPGVGTYQQMRRDVLPRVAAGGYNTLQLMALAEHPYYASFGYHVSSYFAASSRFGTPEELKALIDDAHGMGLRVVMDLVHSHAVANEVEGLSRFDGTLYQYFHDGPRGTHPAWGSRCFDYGKPAVLHFLLSNCRYWLDEFHVDGFRFDGVTSMLYHHRGLGRDFTSYGEYFGADVDEDALAYLGLANKLVHRLRPDAITVAEDVSGMPGLAAPLSQGGCGFDCRLAMGVPDLWFRLTSDTADESWNVSHMWHELTNRRAEERTISYAESHDQALVGGKTLLFEMAGEAVYDAMHVGTRDMRAQRAVALHKMIRLATLGAAGHGYLSFMGNEFGHPEWIDFPREGNGWSYEHARRQWSLADHPDLLYGRLAAFDRAMLALERQYGFLGRAVPRRLPAGEQDKVLAFERGGLLFLFNFHPETSLPDYSIEAPRGRYEHVLDTDEEAFGGQGRIRRGQSHETMAVRTGSVLRHCLRVYLPCRAAMVLRTADMPAGGGGDAADI